MKVKKIFSILLFFCFLIAFAYGNNTPAMAGTLAANATPTPRVSIGSVTTKVMTFKDLGYIRDETMQGVTVNRSYTVNWPSSWIAEAGNKVTLKFSHSNVLRIYSSMAVDWNGTRLDSQLFSNDNAEGATVEVEIPTELIQPGYNQLMLVFYMGIHDDRCQDPDNPSIWATIHSSSFFTFSYTIAQPTPDLGLYPSPLIDTSSLVENSITFITAEQPGESDLQALAMISAKLGQLADWRPIQFQVLSEAEKDSATITGDVIYIGSTQSLKIYTDGTLPFAKKVGSDIKLYNDRGYEVAANAGVIWERISPTNPEAVEIFVTGLDDASVQLAARALGSTSTFQRFIGPSAVIYSVPEPTAEKVEYKQSVIFSDLGYQDETSTGTRSQSINFIMPLTRVWQVLTEAEVTLHFAHSKLLHPDRSALTLSVNNSPVGSILLNMDNAEDAYATFRVPAQVFKIGDNKITVSTNVDMVDGYDNPAQCSDDHNTEAWVVVYKDSKLNLPGGPSLQTLDLADYPAAFVGATDLTDMAFVVPDQANTTIAQAIVLIASRIGQSAKGDVILPTVLSASSPDVSSPKLSHQILIGKPNDNPAIFVLNPVLPLPFTPDSNYPSTSTQIADILTQNGSQGFVEAAMTIDSNPRLVVSGISDEGVLWAASALHDPLMMRDLNGDLALVDSPNSLSSYSIKALVKPASDVTELPGEAPNIQPTTWINWLTGAIFIAAVLLLLVMVIMEISKQRAARKSQ